MRSVAGFAVGAACLTALTPHLWASGGRSDPRASIGGDLISCPSPNHHDGDALRCGYHGRSMRLYSIDAPEMPGACRVGRQCVPGDPYRSRDHLASLTAGRSVAYRIVGYDRYRRPVVQAFADGLDLSCAMVRDGFAIERYGKLRCTSKPSR
jgi:endonuclease YncB( thermonuclease family)